MKFKIEKRQRDDAGGVWVITYRWPARRGEKRRSKVDTRTFRDKRNAEKHALDTLDAIEAFEAGRGPDPFEEQPKDLRGYVERFLAAMAAGALVRRTRRGAPSKKHVTRTKNRLTLMLDRFGLDTVVDLVRFGDGAAERFAALQEELRTEAGGKLNAWGDKTRDEHVATLRQFCSWLVRQRVIASNPVDDVAKLAGDHSVTFRRRALTPDEIDALLVATEQSGPQGAARATLWAFAIYTGLRLGEIAATTWGDLVLDEEHPRVELDGSRTKNGRDTVQEMPRWLAERLHELRRQNPALPTAPVFPDVDWHNIVDPLRLDAQAAGLGEVEFKVGATERGERTRWGTWVDPRGPRWRFDFHSLRHTYNTLVGVTATNPNDARDLARHGDDRTNRRYWHGDRARRRAIVDSLPVPTTATGTATGTATAGPRMSASGNA